ncbi:MAG: universal stress protein [Thermomicrobiales bacterium]
MNTLPLSSSTANAASTVRFLIPWDDETVRDALATFARALGGEDAPVSLVQIDASCHLAGSPSCAMHESKDLPSPDRDAMPACANNIVETAERGDADVILIGTSCRPDGEFDCTCLPAQIALDSPVPVLLVRTSAIGQVFPPIIKRILVPFDGSPRAAHVLQFAARLAQQLALPVHLVMVLDPKQILPPAFVFDPDAEDMVAGFREDAHFALKQGELILDHASVICHSTLLYGPVIGSLKGMIESGDLVMMTTHGLGNAPHGSLGSVAARMISDIVDPLVIMRGIPAEDVVVQGRFA